MADLFISGNGYKCSLGRTYNNSKTILNFLVENHWINKKSRNLVAEFTLYNVDSHIFNQVALVKEKTPFGTWESSYKISSLKLLYTVNDMSVLEMFVFMLFIFFTMLYLCRITYKVITLGVKQLMKNSWNLIDLIIISISISVLALFIQRNKFVENLLNLIEIAKHNEFVNFSDAVFFDKVWVYLNGILVALATVRLWRILCIFKTFYTFVR